jgi:hypothetical protein
MFSLRNIKWDNCKIMQNFCEHHSLFFVLGIHYSLPFSPLLVLLLSVSQVEALLIKY